MKAAKNDTKKASKSDTATGKKSTGFTDQEQAPMRDRLQELKVETRGGKRAGKTDGESAVLAKIAALPQPDRAMGEWLHAIIKATPALH
jgi:ATP-dependent DNA ligase